MTNNCSFSTIRAWERKGGQGNRDMYRGSCQDGTHIVVAAFHNQDSHRRASSLQIGLRGERRRQWGDTKSVDPRSKNELNFIAEDADGTGGPRDDVADASIPEPEFTQKRVGPDGGDAGKEETDSAVERAPN